MICEYLPKQQEPQALLTSNAKLPLTDPGQGPVAKGPDSWAKQVLLVLVLGAT